MTHTYHLTRVSANKKTGPIPVSTTSKSTCPEVCPLKNNGCYADSGPLSIHWRAVTGGQRGGDIDQFCRELRRLPKGQLWRYGQAGDLPGDTRRIDAKDLRKIADANGARHGFAYTHYSPFAPENAKAIADANAAGFTINLSANNLEHADALADLGIAPVVTILPPGQTKNTVTPNGRHVIVCPAVTNDDMDCARCGICAVPSRKAIVGFPAHGADKAKVAQVFTKARVRPSVSATVSTLPSLTSA